MEGTSLVCSFEDASAKERHTTQYFESAGNRAIYHEGGFARTIHRAPWEADPRRTLQDDSAWQLYDVHADFSLTNDLAAKDPKKLAELKPVFLQEATRYHVLPMDDRVFERLDAAAVGRPDLMGGRTSLTLFGAREKGPSFARQNGPSDHHRTSDERPSPTPRIVSRRRGPSRVAFGARFAADALDRPFLADRYRHLRR
jgi:hypothetical protein